MLSFFHFTRESGPKIVSKIADKVLLLRILKMADSDSSGILALFLLFCKVKAI